MCVYISARGENVFDKDVCSDHETVPIDEINIEATIKGHPHFWPSASDGRSIGNLHANRRCCTTIAHYEIYVPHKRWFTPYLKILNCTCGVDYTTR